MTYFTQVFSVDFKTLNDYGAFNISLINDLPLFIDPFLLFASDKQEYKELHESIIKYLSFLKLKSEEGKITKEEIQSWYKFSEVKQNWFGYSLSGNGGRGLGDKFGKSMSINMSSVFKDINKESICETSHLEQVALFQIGIGKDSISDFSCNLIKEYLLKYTQIFAQNYLSPGQIKLVEVEKVYFDYKLEKWMSKEFWLPFYNGDFVILCPIDLLTKEKCWINYSDLTNQFENICDSLPNAQLRNKINKYFKSQLPEQVFVGKGRKKHLKKIPQKEINIAIQKSLLKYTEIISYYVKLKEEDKLEAIKLAKSKVQDITDFSKEVERIIFNLYKNTDFYDISSQCVYDDAIKRIFFLKKVVENYDGYKLFYKNHKPIHIEKDLKLIYRLIWFSFSMDEHDKKDNISEFVDSKKTKIMINKTVVNFKLASNKRIKMYFEKQAQLFKKVNYTPNILSVIFYYNDTEFIKMNSILKELNLDNEKSIILIDACNTKKTTFNNQ